MTIMATPVSSSPVSASTIFPRISVSAALSGAGAEYAATVASIRAAENKFLMDIGNTLNGCKVTPRRLRLY